MKHRIAVLGNCHAQYLAAALTHCFSDIDVRAVGKPFDGPIHFQGTQAEFISAQEVVDWLAAGNGKNIVFRQTTPMASSKFQERLTRLGIEHDLVLFPYIEFRSLTIKKTDPKLSPQYIKARIRADEISNKICLSKAKLPEELYDDFLSLLTKNPCTYTHNHFSGELFHAIFSSSGLTSLIELVGLARMEEFEKSLKLDVGIPHQHVGVPIAQVCEQLGIQWDEKSTQKAKEKAKLPLSEFRALDWQAPQPDEYENYTTWRILIHEAKTTGNQQPILKCLKMYKQGRPYVVWCKNLAEWFISQNRPQRAAVILANRMIKDDTRGLILQWIMDNRRAFSPSKPAKNVFKEAGKKATNSNAKLVSEIFEAME